MKISVVRVLEQSYQEVPYYLSASDREQATLEVSNKIADMRRRILQPVAVHGDGIRNAIHGTYGVTTRNAPPNPSTYMYMYCVCVCVCVCNSDELLCCLQILVYMYM